MDHQTLRVSQSQEDISSADQKHYLQQFYYTMPGQPLPNPAHLGLDTLQGFLCELGMKPLYFSFLKICPSSVSSHNNLGRFDYSASNSVELIGLSMYSET